MSGKSAWKHRMSTPRKRFKDSNKCTDCNVTIEPSRTEKGLVENVGSVGTCQDDDALGGAETVHLDEQLVECVLTLIITSHISTSTTGTTDGVDFVNENDARSVLASLNDVVSAIDGSNKKRANNNKNK
jgi:hypothetical protein